MTSGCGWPWPTPAIGIPAEALEPGPEGLLPIFQRFYRVDRGHSGAASQGGTGLGLSIAHWIARAHGGRIAVESTVGQGSKFTVWLPASSPVSDPTSQRWDAPSF